MGTLRFAHPTVCCSQHPIISPSGAHAAHENQMKVKTFYVLKQVVFLSCQLLSKSFWTGLIRPLGKRFPARCLMDFREKLTINFSYHSP
jgi:hypothetical protein